MCLATTKSITPAICQEVGLEHSPQEVEHSSLEVEHTYPRSDTPTLEVEHTYQKSPNPISSV